MNQTSKKSKSGAILVAAGIFLSRIFGLVRERAFAHYFGNSNEGDAFKAALRIPNFLQNLFGEGALSASFIPVYSNLLAQGKEQEAKKLAETVGAALFMLVTVLCGAGVLLTPVLISVIAPGFEGEKKLLTEKLVQIFFPGIGLLVMAAWCLGILNSHRSFFLSYVAPVFWNIAIIGALIIGGLNYSQDLSKLATITAWGLVLGSFLQFIVQVPKALGYLKGIGLQFEFKGTAFKTVFKNFIPSFISRGVVQISAYVDSIYASLLSAGAVSALSYAQTIYLLPISLFGMSISASELPEMSRATGTQSEIAEHLKKRLNSGLLKIAFFVIPTIIAFVFLGDLIVGTLFQSGKFNQNSTIYVWGILCGSTIGMLAATFARVYSSAFFALKDTRTPLTFAMIRVGLNAIFTYVITIKIATHYHWHIILQTASLTALAGIFGQVEYQLLKRALTKIIGENGPSKSELLKLWAISLVAGVTSFAFHFYLLNRFSLHVSLKFLICAGLFGVIYFVLGNLANITLAKEMVTKARNRLKI